MGRTNQVVAVKFLGYLARLAGQRESSVTVDTDTTVADLLATLAARYGAEFAGAIYRTPGAVHTHVRVFLDEQDAHLTDRIMAGAARPSGSFTPPEISVLVVPGFEGGSHA